MSSIFLLIHLLFIKYLDVVFSWDLFNQQGWQERTIYTLDNPRFEEFGQISNHYGQHHPTHAINGDYSQDRDVNRATAFKLEAEFLVDIKEAIDNSAYVYTKEIRIFVDALYSKDSNIRVFLMKYGENTRYLCQPELIVDAIQIQKYYDFVHPLVFKCPEGISGNTIEVDPQDTHPISIFEIEALVNDLSWYYLPGHGETKHYQRPMYKLTNARFEDANFHSYPFGYPDNAIDNIFPTDKSSFNAYSTGGAR